MAPDLSNVVRLIQVMRRSGRFMRRNSRIRKRSRAESQKAAVVSGNIMLGHEMDPPSPFQVHVAVSSVPGVTRGPGPGPGGTETGSATLTGTETANVDPRANLGSLAELRDLLKAGKIKEVKNFIRENEWPVNDPIRKELWSELCRHHRTDKTSIEGFYWETANQVFDHPEDSTSLPTFVDQNHLMTYLLTEKGRISTKRLVCVLGFTHPDITYCPGLFGIASMMLHYMQEEDVYNALCIMIRSRQGKFLHQTKLGSETAWRTVHALAKKHAKSAYMHLGKFLEGPNDVERLFDYWFWWIFKHLPFGHLVRVMDCYLFEGKKVLYRVAISLILLFYKYSAKAESPLSKEAYQYGISYALKKFCADIPVQPDKLLKIAFGIRALSRNDINRIFMRVEMELKSRHLVSVAPSLLPRSFSSEGFPTSQSQINIHNTSHTLTVKELLTLWSWLPARITMYQPELLYTTEEHGCSLMTFYSRVQNYEPTLLIIKTTNNEVFGAYCSAKWSERNNQNESGQKRTYFGTGETFIFTIFPEIVKYPWVGITREPGQINAGHSSELFMAGDHKMLTIGGGDGQAIWLDENIRFGGTGCCQTFNNAPLCFSQDFECKVVEVIGFI